MVGGRLEVSDANSDRPDGVKVEDKSQRLADWITRTTAILAVIGALSSGRWGAANLMAILEQGKVNDGWNYYQAKSLKEKLAKGNASLAEALAKDLGGRLDSTAALSSYAASMRDEEKRQADEKAGEKKDTEHHEKVRDYYVEGSLWFQISFTFLQVGVVLCTIAGATRSKPIWKTAIVFGVVGLLVLANGFIRKVNVPESWVRRYAKYMENKIDPNVVPAESGQPAEAPPKDGAKDGK